MTAPAVKLFNGDNTQEYTLSSGINFGNVDPGDVSDPQNLNLWNNKDGNSPVADMEYVRMSTVTKNGYTSGDTIPNGKEVVEGLYIQVKPEGEQNFTSIGGINTKTLPNIGGGKLEAPEAPEGAATNDVNGHMAGGTYYYVVSALDETGETLQSVESQPIIVGTGQNAVNLTWPVVIGAVNYKIYRTNNTGVYSEASYIGTAAINNYKDIMANTITGQPLAVATVTYQHKDSLIAQAAVPTNAKAGSTEFLLRYLYRYTS